MIKNDILQKTIDAGTAPLALSYERIELFTSRKIMLRSVLNINSLELGRLTPKEYRVVAGRSKQGGELLTRQIQKVFDEFSSLIKAVDKEIECVTIPILSRTLLEGDASRRIFDEFERNAIVSPERICFELSSDLLFEDINSIKSRFSELRDLNVKIAISELGDEFCPVFRLKGLPFDYAFADKYITEDINGEAAAGLPDIVHMYGGRVIAPGISEDAAEAVRKLKYDGCGYAAGFELSEVGAI